jgi:hypothetical protein
MGLMDSKQEDWCIRVNLRGAPQKSLKPEQSIRSGAFAMSRSLGGEAFQCHVHS